VRAISHAKVKSDRFDARTLARLLHAGMLESVGVSSMEIGALNRPGFVGASKIPGAVHRQQDGSRSSSGAQPMSASSRKSAANSRPSGSAAA
jgi:hypothetical protein